MSEPESEEMVGASGGGNIEPLFINTKNGTLLHIRIKVFLIVFSTNRFLAVNITSKFKKIALNINIDYSTYNSLFI